MRTFYYNHNDYITEESVGPDQRKYTLKDKDEAPRHYIDIEDFNKPFDSIPRTYQAAKDMFGEQLIKKNGSLPWYIQEVMDKLTKAFKEKRKADILLLSADLGHYIGDAHMPLHTSSNHDGQKTNQKGVHALWEARLPELFGESYNLHVEPAKFIPDVTAETWRMIAQTHSLADSVLAMEKKARTKISEAAMYESENGAPKKNKFNQSVHSKEFAKEFHTALNGMVERQMRRSIQVTANYWLTAWTNAGKPDLNELDAAETTERNKPFLKQDQQQLQKTGKVFGLKNDNEF
jgi:hypothetical protein